MKGKYIFLILVILYACCSPRAEQGIPILSTNFRGYIGKAPEYFLLNCRYPNRIFGEIFGNPDSVVVENNQLIIADGNLVSLKVEGITQMDADFYINVPYGEGVRFYFRAAGVDFKISPYLRFDFTTNGSYLYEKNKLLLKVDSVKLINNRTQRVFIQNEGEVFHLIVGIDTVCQGRSRLPLSEYIYVEPIRSKVRIEDVYFYEMHERKYSFEQE